MEKPQIYAYEVYRQRSFSKAAEQLYISQPALSAIIKKLEQDLNTVLFDRSTKPLHLTESGEYYIHCIEQIMAIENGMRQYFDDLSSLQTGRISIGASSYFCSNILPQMMHEFSEQYPGIRFYIIENNSTPTLQHLLRSGEIDLALSSNHYPEAEFDARLYDIETIILAVPKDHAVNELCKDSRMTYEEMSESMLHPERLHPAVRLDLFQDEEFLTIDKNSDLYPRLHLMFDEFHIKPKITMSLQLMSSCYFMASNNFGSTILRAATLRNVKDTDNLWFYYIDSPHSTRPANYYYLRNAYVSKAANAFLDFVCKPITKEPADLG